MKARRAGGDNEKEGEVDRVYRVLKNWILQCEYRPGDFLAEVDLARQCETSRTPIREACNRLSQEGWISRIRHKGYMIPPVSIRDIVEIYEYRKLLECFNAEKAAHTASAEQIARLRVILEVENRPKAPVAEILAANDAFHLGIAEIARNQRVLDQLKLTLEYVHRLDVLSTQRDPGWVPHGEIFVALEARKPVQASKAMAAHVDSARDRMLKLFGT
ncbi:MAG TPA: GntR family transcriptional regulator [Bryobacteraceae bacterium]|nr:GntR family transcriptional regulator [Bryobacteraceae bacterium]